MKVKITELFTLVNKNPGLSASQWTIRLGSGVSNNLLKLVESGKLKRRKGLDVNSLHFSYLYYPKKGELT